MNDNQSLGSAVATLGLVFLAIAIALLLLHFLPNFLVIGILALLAVIFGLCAFNTGQGKLAVIGGLVIVCAAVLVWLLFYGTSVSNPPKPIQSETTIQPRE